ncbi:MAG: bifunctional diaminohydroxyphosphoribosylaminopyrimidine deaminase/5-amino-6-(5-phosphoribosylamino)uracil reductase RibD [Bacteroidota bacterium]
MLKSETKDIREDERLMKRALQLASQGQGNVAPNPMVGCVIAYKGTIIGEGYHQQYGGPHAEVNAINAVRDTTFLSKSTAYVTLEPCSHFGKTPPCADLLIAKHLKRVVIASRDPHDQVDGKGIDKLRAAGIATEVGLLAEEARTLNARFFTFHEKKRPFIILKWAETSDGFIARENFDSKWISNPYSRQLVHKWRAEEAAILIGKNTALHDNPSLTTRAWVGKNPVRVLLDMNLDISTNSNLFDTAAKTIIFNRKRDDEDQNLRFLKVESLDPIMIMRKLYDEDIDSVIVEGGRFTLESLIQTGLWDEARIFKSRSAFTHGIKAPQLHAKPRRQMTIDSDTLTIYQNG